MNALFPPFLNYGDKIAIVSPAGAVDPTLIDGACDTIRSYGFSPILGRYAKSSFGRFSARDEERIDDFQWALDNPNISAILCGRGGYGCMRIIDQLNFEKFKRMPKWLIGFSDITALHALFLHEGFASIHGFMARAFAHNADNHNLIDNIFSILTGEFIDFDGKHKFAEPFYTTQCTPLCQVGQAQGQLVGGNLSLLYALQGTPYAIQPEGKILFIEDISERPYHIDRMMQNLRLAGIFNQISGLIVGQFADCEPDPSFGQSIYEIVRNAVGKRNIPIAFNFPLGHVKDNRPLVHGANVILDIDHNSSTIIYDY